MRQPAQLEKKGLFAKICQVHHRRDTTDVTNRCSRCSGSCLESSTQSNSQCQCQWYAVPGAVKSADDAYSYCRVLIKSRTLELYYSCCSLSYRYYKLASKVSHTHKKPAASLQYLHASAPRQRFKSSSTRARAACSGNCKRPVVPDCGGAASSVLLAMVWTIARDSSRDLDFLCFKTATMPRNG